ncbi:MAG TPA: tRNA lysidine(34) synthetase TilS, partial [Candidatus Eremiobacteraceae bacterium]|nr:tRNA lysidine(34) synthetase TilS [Candidatus Eremiobacteraceae bacterium]
MQRRFARACRGLKLPLEGATLLVACSGGVDSAAALALLRRAAPQSRLIACYIDHGLRPALAIRRDIAAVRDQARAANAEVCVRRVTAPLGRGSLEEQARLVRYALLADVAQEKDAHFVIAGQHSDDVAESLLLALIRGSGLDGVAAMPAKRALSASVMLVRPLLWADRSALQAFVETLGVRVSEDETNADVRLRRNAVRALLAAVERVMPGTRGNIARAARLLRGDKALLAVYTARAWRRCKSEKHAGLETRLLRTLPLPLLRRVIRYAIVAGCGSARNF